MPSGYFILFQHSREWPQTEIIQRLIDIMYIIYFFLHTELDYQSEFTYGKVKELIKHQQEKYDWEFIFLGANIDAEKEADSIGIGMDNVFSFEASKDGVEKMYCMVCEEVSERRHRAKKSS
jgi:hypothetical protein